MELEEWYPSHHPVCHALHEALNLYLSEENVKRMSISFSGKNQVNAGKFSDQIPPDTGNLQRWLFSQIKVFVFRDFRVSSYFLFHFGFP